MYLSENLFHVLRSFAHLYKSCVCEKKMFEQNKVLISMYAEACQFGFLVFHSLCERSI